VSVSAREIAEQYDIPIELMAKVLQRLVRSGLLVSTQGTRGGYTLRRPAASISVADVIQSIDGPFTVTACSTENSGCEQYSKCSIRDPLSHCGRARHRVGGRARGGSHQGRGAAARSRHGFRACRDHAAGERLRFER
jgi:Rrf2 family protein